MITALIELQPIVAQIYIAPEWLGIIMLICLFGAIVVGFPIAQTLLVMSFGFGFIGFGSTAFNLFTNKTNEVMTDVTLAAVPLFLLMGYVLEQAGLMNRLFRALQLALANLRGSLYLAVIAAATIFAAATGIVGASVTLIGLMAIPSMTKSGYDTRLSAGAITAGGTLGILIPPSIMLVVMAPVVGVKVLDLFAAAIIPGLLLSLLYTGYAMIRSWRNPALGPPLAEDERADNVGEIVKEIALGIIPPLVLISATLGSILAGWATPTEASAMGAVGSLLLALFGGKMNLAMLKRSLVATLETSSMIMILIVASNFFGAVFSRLGSATYVANGLVQLRLPTIIMLLLILLFIFVLGWPLEWVPIVLIFIPILLPVVNELNINLVWFSILVAVTLQTAWLSPPVALSAYFLKGVAPHWDLKDIYAGMFQFMGLQLVGLALVVLFPAFVFWLPDILNPVGAASREISEGEVKWEERDIDSYSYTVNKICAECGEVGDWQVVVKDGTLVSLTPADADEHPGWEEQVVLFNNVATVPDLFEEATKSTGSSEFDLKFDDEFGIPTEISSSGLKRTNDSDNEPAQVEGDDKSEKILVTNFVAS